MKTKAVPIVLFVALATTMVAQSNASGVEVSTANGIATFKNVGSSGIVALAARMQLEGIGQPGLMRHDHYFKPMMNPCDSFDIDLIYPDDRNVLSKFPAVIATVVWVQYADGSTWGDGSNPLIQEMLANREEGKVLLKRLKATSSQADFDAVLANAYAAPRSFAGKLALQIKGVEHDMGYNVAVTHVNDRLTSAKSHKF